jgi:hypothetical protein
MKNGGGHFAPELGGQYHWNLQVIYDYPEYIPYKIRY